MKKRFLFIVILLLLLILPLHGDFKIIKENRYTVHYDPSLNLFSLEYVLKLLKNTDEKFLTKFSVTNTNTINLYLYNDTIKFMFEQKAMWWENYRLKPDSVAINNIELFLQKNSLHDLLDYVLFKLDLLNLYKDRLSTWFINGVAIYYSESTLFKNGSYKFSSLQEMTNKLNKYQSKEEMESANYYCYKSIKYLADQYGEEKILQYLNMKKDLKEFENGFFNFFGISYNEFIQFSLKLQ